MRRSQQPPDEARQPVDNALDERPSKSARKREVEALQDLGSALVELTDGDLKTIPLDDELADAIAVARRIRDFSGKRRQLQFIGKLMRKIDTTPIEAAYNDLLHGQQQRNEHFHQLEALRDRLVGEGIDAMGAVLDAWPHADRQHLRQLILAAQKEHAANQPPAAARKLFKYLREMAEV